MRRNLEIAIDVTFCHPNAVVSHATCLDVVSVLKFEQELSECLTAWKKYVELRPEGQC